MGRSGRMSYVVPAVFILLSQVAIVNTQRSGPKSGDRPSVDEGPLDNRKLDISGEVTTTKHAGNATPMISESKSGSSGEANVLIYPILGAVSGLVVLATVVSIYCNVRKERSHNADEQNRDVKSNSWNAPEAPYNNDQENADLPQVVQVDPRCSPDSIPHPREHTEIPDYEIPLPPPPLPEALLPQYTPDTGTPRYH